MNTRERRTRQEHALLVIAEWLRDELLVGAVHNARHKGHFERLKDLAFNALGDPSMKDADDIKRRYNELNGKRP